MIEALSFLIVNIIKIKKRPSIPKTKPTEILRIITITIKHYAFQWSRLLYQLEDEIKSPKNMLKLPKILIGD